MIYAHLVVVVINLWNLYRGAQMKLEPEMKSLADNVSGS